MLQSMHFNLFHQFVQEANEGMQQGPLESGFRDLMVMFSSWEFSPVAPENPFVNTSTSVHIWQGSEDYYAPVTLQSYIARSLAWIHYHKLLGKGHFLPGVPGYNDDVVRHLLLDDTKLASAKYDKWILQLDQGSIGSAC
jgi:hypothetical protein